MAYKVNELPATLRQAPWNFDPAQGTLLTDFQSGHGYTTSGADGTSNVNDTSQFVAGSQCATVVSAGTGASAILQNTSITSTDTTNLQVALVLMCPDTTHLSTIDFSMGNGGFTNEYHVQFASQVNLASGAWQVVTLSLGDATSQGSPTRTSIDHVRVYFKDDNTGNKVTVHWQAIWFMPNAANQKGVPFPNGVASICFDDGFATGWATAKPYLDAYGYRASAFLIKDLIGGSGRVTLAEAQALQDQAGWEVNAHAYLDADHGTTDTGISAAQLAWDKSAEKEWLLVNGLAGQGYAFPLGNASPATVSVYKQYFRYARGTQQLTETWPPGDPYRLKAISSIGEFTGGYSPALISQSGGKIDEAVTNASWLILTFHNVIPAVSSVTMSGNTATIVFAGAIPTTASWQAAQSIIMAGFTPSGLNGTFTIASRVNSTTITVNIGSNPGNGTIMGTAVTATTDCSYPAFTAIIDKLHSSGIKVLPVAEAFAGGDLSTGAASNPLASPMTALGDLIYENATPAAARLAGPTSSTKQFLTSTGTGSAANAPAWGTIAAGDLPTGTTSAQGALQLDGTAGDIAALAASAAAGSVGKAADAGHGHPTTGLLTRSQLSPADHGLIAWNFPPYNVRSTDHPVLTAGELVLAKLYIPAAQTISKIGFYVAQAGTSLTSTENLGALFGPTGTLLSSTADLTTDFGTTGAYLVSLGSGQAVSAGYVYVGFFFNGTGTAVGLGVGDTPSALLNVNLSAANSLWANDTTNTGRTTTMPGSLGTLAGVSDGIWACVA